MKRWICCLLALCLSLSCVACGLLPQTEKTPETEKTQETTPQKEPEVLNPLTGTPLKNAQAVNGRPVAVMLNNLKAAMPQMGVSQADIIYEYIVEGGITRMVGIFQDVSQVGTIGTVRSARPCFVETAAGLDAIYVHAGGSDEAYRDMESWGIDHMDGCGAEEDLFWRDAARMQSAGLEHSMLTSGQNLSTYLPQSGFRLTHKSGYTYPVTFVADGTPAAGTPASKVTVQFSHYKTGVFTYDAAKGLYKIEEYDAPYVDGNTSEQVGVTNLLVLKTSVVNSGDGAGHMIVDLKGSGSGTYFCGGKAEEVTWHKNSVSDPFTYTLSSGASLAMGTGHTYVCVISKESSVMTVEP